MILKSFKKMWRNRGNGKINSWRSMAVRNMAKQLFIQRYFFGKTSCWSKEKTDLEKTYHYAPLKIKTLQDNLANHHIENEKWQFLLEDVNKQKKLEDQHLEVKDWEEYRIWQNNYSFKWVTRNNLCRNNLLKQERSNVIWKRLIVMLSSKLKDSKKN